MTTKRQSAITARERERRAWDLYCEGRSQADIAAELAMTQQGVSKALKRVEARVTAELRGKAMSHRTRQTERLERLYAIAMEGYRRSQMNGGHIVTKTLPGKLRRDGTRGPGREIVTKKSEVNIGDPRFLAEARGALADIRKLWGLDAPTKVAMVDADRPLESLTDAELHDQMRALVTEAQQLGLDLHGITMPLAPGPTDAQ